jgi:hypothetical protein
MKSFDIVSSPARIFSSRSTAASEVAGARCRCASCLSAALSCGRSYPRAAHRPRKARVPAQQQPAKASGPAGRFSAGSHISPSGPKPDHRIWKAPPLSPAEWPHPGQRATPSAGLQICRHGRRQNQQCQECGKRCEQTGCNRLPQGGSKLCARHMPRCPASLSAPTSQFRARGPVCRITCPASSCAAYTKSSGSSIQRRLCSF